MAPWHPVPTGYGSSCDEGEIVTQGTGSRMAINLEVDDGEFEPEVNNRRCPRDLSSGHLFDC